MSRCPDCDREDLGGVSRRQFVQAAGAAVAVAAAAPRVLLAAPEATAKPESLVKTLFDSLTPQQKEEVCFDWDYKDDRGILRTHVSNNWQITGHKLAGGFYTKDQQDIVEALFWGMYSPDWHDRIRKQIKDDAGGYGKEQSLAIFGQPGTGKFEFVMTGRHLTIRCDGDSTEHVAFGGPIFYGHAAAEFNEPADHAGNVFWPQALKANELYKMLDGKQQKLALIEKAPPEREVHFRGKSSEIPGLPISELSADQKSHAKQVLATLLEPYRSSDQLEAHRCLDAQGGLDQCRLAFYQSGDLGDDKVWDNWRLEGPSFVWHYRGAPHVHVWVNIADSADVKITTKG
jgi:hypothetical protein